jgi:hypothetical protein
MVNSRTLSVLPKVKARKGKKMLVPPGGMESEGKKGKIWHNILFHLMNI